MAEPRGLITDDDCAEGHMPLFVAVGSCEILSPAYLPYRSTRPHHPLSNMSDADAIRAKIEEMQRELKRKEAEEKKQRAAEENERRRKAEVEKAMAEVREGREAEAGAVGRGCGGGSRGGEGEAGGLDKR